MIIYEDVTSYIKNVSGPQLVALFCVIVDECLRKDCFQSEGMKNTISNIENNIIKKHTCSTSKAKPEIMKLTCSKCNASFILNEKYIHRRCGLNGCEGRLHKL